MPAVFLFLSFLYTETVFKLSVETAPDERSFIFIGLFSLCAALILSGVLFLLPKKAVRVIIPLCLFAVFFSFIIEFLIHRAFKMVYDLNTVSNAATGELATFGNEIKELIFCDDGISHILLFLFPLIVWFALKNTLTAELPLRGIFGKDAKKALFSSLGLLLGGAAAYGLSLLLILGLGWSRGTYTDQYNFETAVLDFGLTEGIVLDARNIALSRTAAPVFEAEKTPPAVIISPPSSPAESSEEEPAAPADEKSDEPVVYGYNISDIDFEELAIMGGPCADINAYVASLPPSSENEYTGIFKGKNLILICAEAFSGCIIDPELTPTLYRLSTKGINFDNYYQQSVAGTTGGEYQLLFGLIPASGGTSIRTITKNGTHTNIGALLDDEGYYGMAFHNSSYTYYGRDETHNKMGYSEGFMGMGNGLEELISHRWPESDLEMMQATMPMYLDHQPFNAYYMTVSGHSGYLYSNNAMSKENKETVDAWCEKKGLSYSEPVRAYISANLELEKALSYVVETLEEKGIASDTVICIAPDHFPYGLDSNASLGDMPYLSELYGYNVTTYEERDRNRAIIWCGSLEEDEPIVVNSPTSSIDILPTLCNLFDVDWDCRLYPGRDVLSDAFPLAFFGNYDWKTDLGYYNASRGKFTPANDDIVIPDGYAKEVSALVRNKMTFCRSVLSYDYYTQVYEAAGK